MYIPNKNFSVRRLSDAQANNFWRMTSENIFKNSNKPSNFLNPNVFKHIENDLNNASKIQYKKRKNPFTFPKIERTAKVQLAKINSHDICDFIDTKKRSIDKLDFRTKDWLDRYVTIKKPQRKAVLIKKPMKTGQNCRSKMTNDNVKILLNPRLLKSYSNSGISAEKDNFSRRSSVDSLVIFKKFPKTFFKPTKIDNIINLLKTILSPGIMRSVFVKDFVILYKKFYKYPNYQFNYRPKSADRKDNDISIRKAVLLQSATFKDFLLNMYKHYDIQKNHNFRNIKIGHLFADGSNCVVDNNADSYNGRSKIISSSNVSKKLQFNFLQFNKDGRHFTKIVKHFNKTGEFRLLDPKKLVYKPQLAKKKKLIRKPFTIKLPLDKKQSLNRSESNSKILMIKNPKTATLFQKVVNIGLQRDSHIERRNEIKTVFSKAVRKTIVISHVNHLRRIHESLPENNMKKSSHIINVDAKNTLVDINILYRLPKTLDTNKLSKSKLPMDKQEAVSKLSLLSYVDFTKRRSTYM